MCRSAQRAPIGRGHDWTGLECLDTPTLPPWVPRTHAPRKRHDYTYDRPLPAVGIDEGALEERLASYIAWCRGDA